MKGVLALRHDQNFLGSSRNTRPFHVKQSGEFVFAAHFPTDKACFTQNAGDEGSYRRTDEAIPASMAET